MSIKNGWHYNDELNCYYGDEVGNRIPENVCLCFAKEPPECACDCTSWNNYKYEDDYD